MPRPRLHQPLPPQFLREQPLRLFLATRTALLPKTPNNQVAGYFLNGTGLDDVAVLRITSFANETADQATAPLTFVNTTLDFFAAAAAANKTKLILDVLGNGGGNTILPNDVVSIPHSPLGKIST
jgi:C-terminal processing protease CtpA/Prc